jgi:hypothetical protein
MDEMEAKLAQLKGILFEQSQRFIKYDRKEIFMIHYNHFPLHKKNKIFIYLKLFFF